MVQNKDLAKVFVFCCNSVGIWLFLRVSVSVVQFFSFYSIFLPFFYFPFFSSSLGQTLNSLYCFPNLHLPCRAILWSAAPPFVICMSLIPGPVLFSAVFFDVQKLGLFISVLLSVGWYVCIRLPVVVHISSEPFGVYSSIYKK